MLRRLLDILVALFALLISSPLLAVLGVAVRVDSPGPAFYGGRRVGKDGRVFKLWKLRSMAADADRAGPGVTAKHDLRITRVGRFLRQTKLDELPQMWNLLVGDLTLVGPRAETPELVERYTPDQKWILSVTPGLTSPGTLFYATEQEDSFPVNVPAEDYYLQQLLDRKLQIDREYLESRSMLSDLRVVFRTVRHVLRALAGRSAR
jgi:lipopolysaccharide/colanic/teichoic acid biosynthesis glycosyltransferase